VVRAPEFCKLRHIGSPQRPKLSLRSGWKRIHGYGVQPTSRRSERRDGGWLGSIYKPNDRYRESGRTRHSKSRIAAVPMGRLGGSRQLHWRRSCVRPVITDHLPCRIYGSVGVLPFVVAAIEREQQCCAT